MMPELTGKEALDQINEISPGTNAIFVTGYSADEFSNFEIDEDVHLINKPFKSSALLRQVRDVLDA